MHHGATTPKYPPNQPPTMNHGTIRTLAVIMWAVITLGSFVAFAAILGAV